jgi:hypothetical protein
MLNNDLVIPTLPLVLMVFISTIAPYLHSVIVKKIIQNLGIKQNDPVCPFCIRLFYNKSN